MPKRILDGDAMWSSDKIRALPAWAKAEFAWLLPLALANGVFECDARRIWATAYAYARPEMSIDQIVEVLHAFGVVGLLFRWREASGKEWGYWVGIEKPGRLLAPSRIYRKEGVCGPPPPKDLLAQYVRNTYEGQVRIGQESQVLMVCSKSSVQTPKKQRNGNYSTDDLKKLCLEKCENPNEYVSTALDIIISRAESSGVTIRSPQYLEKALDTFNFAAGQDREELLQAMRKTPL